MKTIFAILFVTTFWFSTTNTLVYEALSGDSLETVENALSSLNTANTNSLNNAYSGALMMKKASFLKVPAKKVNIFKKGAKLLEAEIAAYPNNTEYRFLRLAVQENAPSILKYNKNIDEDKTVIINNFTQLNAELKRHIQDFASKSANLSTTELKD